MVCPTPAANYRSRVSQTKTLAAGKLDFRYGSDATRHLDVDAKLSSAIGFSGMKGLRSPTCA